MLRQDERGDPRLASDLLVEPFEHVGRPQPLAMMF